MWCQSTFPGTVLLQPHMLVPPDPADGVCVPDQATSTTVTSLTPPDATIAPPGYYMMFIISSDGVPSVASFVLISGEMMTGPSPAVTLPSKP